MCIPFIMSVLAYQDTNRARSRASSLVAIGLMGHGQAIHIALWESYYNIEKYMLRRYMSTKCESSELVLYIAFRS